MAQVPILNGVYTDVTPDFRTSYPRNMVPVPKDSGISKGYLRPADGLKLFGEGSIGIDRGGINWRDACYRVMGTQLVRVTEDGEILLLGEILGDGQVTMDYSFDRLAIASGGKLYYWNGTDLLPVTDPDLGYAVDFIWVDGYFMITDGTSLIVTELNDPFAINPLKYGSAEIDPDKVVGLIKVRNEPWAMGRYTIEAFRNIGGSEFPFQRIDGAQIMRGAVGTFAFASFLESVAFVGSARNEPLGVWMAVSGGSQKISTREIDTIFQDYTEAQLANIVVEARVDKGHQHLWIRLPDQTLVYDAAASAMLGEPVWFTLTSSIAGKGQYRAQNLVWVYNAWHCGDPKSMNVGVLVDNVSSHYGELNGWDFGTAILYNEGRGAIIHSIELVGLPGYAAFGDEPIIWTSSSVDGTTWSQEHPISAGNFGQSAKRLAWRRQGHLRNWRIQKFRGMSDSHLAFARLQMEIEPLAG